MCLTAGTSCISSLVLMTCFQCYDKIEISFSQEKHDLVDISHTCMKSVKMNLDRGVHLNQGAHLKRGAHPALIDM